MQLIENKFTTQTIHTTTHSREVVKPLFYNTPFTVSVYNIRCISKFHYIFMGWVDIKATLIL